MFSDLQSPYTDAEIRGDLCIIGGGIAGLTLAHEFAGEERKVVVLEAGPRQVSDESQALFSAECSGVKHDGIHEGRFRAFGGTSTRWGGQLLPLDESDFLERSHVPDSGWPIGHRELVGYYRRAEKILRVSALSYDEELAHQLGLSLPDVGRLGLRMRYSKWAAFRFRNLAQTIGEQCIQSKNVHIFLNAPVSRITMAPDGTRIESVSVRNGAGQAIPVLAKTFVLCCGALENARLLLIADGTGSSGLGDGSGLVGRFFQDHISYRAAELFPSQPEVLREFFAPVFSRGTMHYPRIELTPQEQARLRVNSAFSHVAFEAAENSGHMVLRECLRKFQEGRLPIPPMRMWCSVIRDAVHIAYLGWCSAFGGRVQYPRGARYFLQVDVEQTPNKQSRVTLSPEKDLLGMPKLRLDWKVQDSDRLTAAEMVRKLQGLWGTLQLGKAVWNEAVFEEGDHWLAFAKDSFHQAGTTRMAADPGKGVVDKDLKVFGIENLFVAGCSVFPTSGSANPTFTMMALCIRLADFLKSVKLPHSDPLARPPGRQGSRKSASMNGPSQSPTLSDIFDLLVLYAAKWRRRKLSGSNEAGREQFYEQFFERSDEELYLRDPRMLVRRATISEALSRHVPEGGKVLDVGCGLGDVLEGIGEKYLRFGIDYSAENVRVAQNRFGERAKISCGSAYSIPHGAGEFDAVICLEVLEHLEDDRKAVAEISRVLKHDGVLIVSVPSTYYWPSYRKLIGHLRHYSRQALSDLLAAGNLSILEDLPTFPAWHKRYMRGYLWLRSLTIMLRVLGFRVSSYDLRMPWRAETCMQRLRQKLDPLLEAERKPDRSFTRSGTFSVATKKAQSGSIAAAVN